MMKLLVILNNGPFGFNNFKPDISISTPDIVIKFVGQS